MHKHFESFAELGHTYTTFTYDYRGRAESLRSYKLDAAVKEAALAAKPDVIVYIGACAGNIPSTSLWCELRETVAPTVHLVSDAADEPWWFLLQEYDAQGAFTVLCTMDGNPDWPNSKKHITGLTPVPLAYYPEPIPHADRKMVFGFAGNCGNHHVNKDGTKTGRMWMVEPMRQFGLQTRQRGTDKDGYDGYKDAAEFNRQSRITVNFPRTGSYERFHVKGRVIEAGMAGCLLLEQKGSPTPLWFTPGTDYLEWQTADEVRWMVEHYAKHPEESQAIGWNLRAKVMAQHTPAHFWQRIFDKAELKA